MDVAMVLPDKFQHPETLHRAFQRQVGTSPDRYRQHFGRRAS